MSTTYILAGVYSNWMTTVEVGGKDVTSAKYRQEQLLLQLEALAAQVVELGGVPVVDIPNRDRTDERERKIYPSLLILSEKRKINPYVPKWDIGIAPPSLLILSDKRKINPYVPFWDIGIAPPSLLILSEIGRRPPVATVDDII